MIKTNKLSELPHLIIIGGGFAGLELVKQLRNKPVRVTLLDRHNYHTFQPLLYQIASGGLSPDAIAYPLRKVIGKLKNIGFRMAEVKEVLVNQNKLATDIGVFDYDYVCIATGSKTNFFGNAELERNCMQLKSIPDALDLRSEILQEFEKALSEPNPGSIERILNFVVVGGGPTGVETAGALAEMKKTVLPADYKELDSTQMHVHLIEASPKVLGVMHASSSEGAMKFLKELGVQVRVNTSVQAYDGKTLKLNTGDTLETETVIWSAGVMGKSIAGIPAEKIAKGNRYKVNAYNQVEGYENIFAIGDIASMSGDGKYLNGHPMVAPVAVQQAQLFAKNLVRLMRKEEMKRFSYFDKGSMATVGRHRAVFEAFGIRMQGYIAWLAWMFLHLMLLVGFRNRVIVFINWLWNYVSYQRAIRLITRPFVRKQGKDI